MQSGLCCFWVQEDCGEVNHSIGTVGSCGLQERIIIKLSRFNMYVNEKIIKLTTASIEFNMKNLKSDIKWT